MATAKKKKSASTSKKKASKAAKRPAAQRADYGAPIDDFFGKQPKQLQPILVELRKLVESTLPGVESSLKWGMPFYTLKGEMICALGGHKSHVNLVLAAPPGVLDDPDGQLEGDGKTGRRLVLKSLDDLPVARVRTWLRTVAKHAASKK